MLARVLCVCFLAGLLTSTSLSANAIPSKSNNNDNAGRKVVLLDADSFKTQILRKNTVYVISDIIDLQGAIVAIPEGVTLQFTEGGEIRHGIVKLSSGCKVVGGIFRFSTNDANLFLYREQKMSSPIVAIDVSDIRIEGTSFFYDAAPNTGYPCITIYGKNLCCSNITVKKCQFFRTGVGVYSNVDGAIISDNIFDNSAQTLSVETLYDNRPYRHPKNVKFLRNTVYSNIPNLTYPPFWLSGVEGLELSKNHIVTASDAIMLYCGDGNIAMERVTIRKNTFEISKRKPGDDTWKHCIMVRGKSFPYQKEGLNFGNDIVISDNDFLSHDNSVETLGFKNRAVSITWCNDITVKNNQATGFSNFVVVADTFKGYRESVTHITISKNKVIDTYDKPILITEEIGNGSIKRNKLLNCNVAEDVTKPLKELKSSVLTRNKIQIKQ